MAKDKKLLQARWEAFRSMEFPPGCADVDPNGVCLVSMDTYAAGCITTYLHSALPAETRKILETCSGKLKRALAADALSDQARTYFTELTDIAIAVLAATD